MSLDKLPLDTIVDVMGYIDGFSTLAAFLRACPQPFRIFSRYGGHLLDESAWHTKSLAVLRLMRSVAMLRSSPEIFFHSNKSPIEDILLRHAVTKADADGRIHLLSHSCAQDAGLAYSLVAKLHKMELLAEAAWQFFQGNFVNARPEHLSCPNDDYPDQAEYPWRCNFPGQPYEVCQGPLAWKERQGICRTLWRLQLLYEMRQALGLTQSVQHLEPQLAQQLLEFDLSNMFAMDNYHSSAQLYELIAMLEFLHHGQKLPIQGPLHFPLTLAKVQCLPRVSMFAVQETWPYVPFNRYYFTDMKGPMSFGTLTMNLMSNYSFSPIRNVPFHYYFRFGMPFWERHTLQRFQMNRTRNTKADCLFTMRSLLTQAQLRSVNDFLEQELSQSES